MPRVEFELTSQCSSGRRQYVPQTARPLGPAVNVINVRNLILAESLKLDIKIQSKNDSGSGCAERTCN
jgi:hypothetical protein